MAPCSVHQSRLEVNCFRFDFISCEISNSPSLQSSLLFAFFNNLVIRFRHWFCQGNIGIFIYIVKVWNFFHSRLIFFVLFLRFFTSLFAFVGFFFLSLNFVFFLLFLPVVKLSLGHIPDVALGIVPFYELAGLLLNLFCFQENLKSFMNYGLVALVNQFHSL